MSFESDLLTWARRQINLPPLLGLPPDQQRKLLQRLLTGAILPRLEAIRPGSAEDPEIREAIRVIPEIVVSENEFVLERGLVIVQQAALSIHASTELILEWQGPAPPYTWLNIEHPQGELSISAVTCPGLVLAPTWTGAEFLGAQGEYQSRATPEQIQAWRIDGMRDSVLYTGLLRLLAEGWGPHESLGKLQPGTWPIWTTTEASYRGVIRVRDDVAQTYRWYMVYLGPTLGCRAVQLTPDASVSCLVDELYNGALTPAEWVITEAWVLRKLARDPATQELSLITKTEYDQTVIGFTLGHGWKFAPQRRGTALENSPQANIVVLEYEEVGNENWYNTRHCVVDFDFNGTLSASLSLVEQGKMFFDFIRHPLWEEEGPGLVCRTMPKIAGLPSNAPSDLSDVTPVYCVGFDDSDANLLEYHKKQFVNELGQPGYSGTKLTACMGDTVSEAWYDQDTLVTKGGWSTNHQSANDDLVSNFSEKWTRTFHPELDGGFIEVANRAGLLSAPGCQATCKTSIDTTTWRLHFDRAHRYTCPEQQDAVIAERDAIRDAIDGSYWGPIAVQGSKATFTKQYEKYAEGGIAGHSAIIPSEDAESIILLTGQARLENEEQAPGGVRTISRQPQDGCSTGNFPSSAVESDPVGAWQFTVGKSSTICQRGSVYLYDKSSCYNNDPNGGCVAGQSFQTTDIPASPSTGQLWIINGNQVIQGTDEFDKLKDYISTTLDNLTRPWNPVVKTQYGGAAIYQEKPELTETDGVKSNAGFNSQALSDGIDFRFVSS